MVDVGYQYAQGNWIFAAEFDLGYAMGSAATVNGSGSNVNGLHTTELLKVGGNLSALFGTQTPITIPAQLSAAVISPYAAIGQAQWQLAGRWANGTVSGAGVLFDIGTQWFGDLRYTYTDFSAAKAAGITVNNDRSFDGDLRTASSSRQFRQCVTVRATVEGLWLFCFTTTEPEPQNMASVEREIGCPFLPSIGSTRFKGGAVAALLLLGALGWMDRERRRLLRENTAKDLKLEAMSERMIALMTKIEMLLFNGGHKGL